MHWPIIKQIHINTRQDKRDIEVLPIFFLSSLFLISLPFQYKKRGHKHPQADISRAKLTRTVFFSLYDGRRPGQLGTVQTPWECVPCYLLPPSNVHPAAKLPCPVTLTLDSCVSIHKTRLCATKADKGTKKQKGTLQRDSHKTDSILYGLMINLITVW